MDFFSGTASFLTESSMIEFTLDILEAELWTWVFWIALSTVRFMKPWEEMVTGLELLDMEEGLGPELGLP